MATKKKPKSTGPRTSPRRADASRRAPRKAGQGTAKQAKSAGRKAARKTASKPASKPARKTTRRPATKPARKTTRKPASKPARKTASKPARTRTRKAARTPAAGRTTRKKTYRPAKTSGRRTAKKSTAAGGALKKVRSGGGRQATPSSAAAGKKPATGAQERRLKALHRELEQMRAQRDARAHELEEARARLADAKAQLADAKEPASQESPLTATEPILAATPSREEDAPGAEDAIGQGMKRFQSAESQRRFSRDMRDEGKKIGFVPTMGAFHQGHLSLIEKARSQNDIVVVSIFVNPLQFGPEEDFDRYPRDLARDIDLCRAAGVDAVFQPDVGEMYPEGFTTRITVGPMGERLCGAFRPGHFDGVCTVVAKLIGIVAPHRVYLGEKDAQQVVILDRMVNDLNMDTKLVACPTIREKDGLAMSSRNSYLTPEERAQAGKIHEALRIAQREILVCNTRDPRELAALMRDVIQEGTQIEVQYIEMVDPETLEPRPLLEGRTLIAVRARLGRTALIDNMLINVPGGRMAMTFKTPGCEEGRPGGGPQLKRRR